MVRRIWVPPIPTPSARSDCRPGPQGRAGGIPGLTLSCRFWSHLQNGYGIIDFPPGTYQLAISEATAVYASIESASR